MTLRSLVFTMAAVAVTALSGVRSYATDNPADAHSSCAFRGQPLFNGVSFEGWEGGSPWFRIVDRAVVGGSLTSAIPQNEFLVTADEYRDFELHVKVRLTNGKANGGVQFRSQRVAGSGEMSGYQADAASRFWGGLWDESRRARFLGTRLNQDVVQKALKPDGWNAYIIRAEGQRIRIWLNGIATLDYIEQDPSIPQAGHIGLQIHAGPPSEASYKDIELQVLQPNCK